jgi:hypothetical protein
MDYETNRFQALLLNRTHLDKLITNENLYKFVNGLSQIKGNPKEIMNIIMDGSDDLLIGGWTIFNPVCLIIIVGLLLLFGIWTSIVSLYLGVTCDLCCYISLPETI